MSAFGLNVDLFFQGGEEHSSEGEEASQLEDDDTTLDDIKVKNKIGQDNHKSTLFEIYIEDITRRREDMNFIFEW